MEKPKFTPGPWELVGYEDSADIRRTFNGGHTLVATVHGDCPVSQANAALISAAPDMYKALKAVQESFDLLKENMPEGVCKGSVRGYFLTVDTEVAAALAKAEGRG